MAQAPAPGIGSSLPPRAQKSEPTPEEDNSLFSNLPRDMQEEVLSRSALQTLVVLPCLSKEWRATFTTPYFRTLLHQAHPKMIAIVGFLDRFRLTVAMFDLASRQWHYRVLRTPMYELSWGTASQACFAHDAGLLCFVPSDGKKACPIVVCNPLTNEWKALPFPETGHFLWNPLILQLVVNVTTRHYKVTVLHRYLERQVTVHAAEVYDSATNLWSKKEDGVVFGRKFFQHNQLSNYSNYYDCTTGTEAAICESHSESLRPGQGADFMTASERDQRVFKLEHRHSRDTYRVSEYALLMDGSGGVRKINSCDSSLQLMSHPSHVSLMASERFLLLVADNCKVEGQKRRQQTIHVCDQVAGTWHQIPALKKEYSGTKMKKYFMCELRWNATP